MSDIQFLPIDFLNRMESELGSDFHAFLCSYEENKISALRLNPLKVDDEVKKEGVLDELVNMITGSVSWCPTGFYYDEECRPGLHPFHAAGVIYIQDSSAQLPVELLDPKPKDFVLDLCAAPGGKSTQIAGKLKGEGLLICNEPMKPRAKILSENIERLGVTNAVVTSEYPDKLRDKFGTFFDKILVDAPCSGEGMFRKNHDACQEWSLENVEMCAARQAEILECAYEMLIPGGRICYSTCTFSRQEDELQIESFLSKHNDLRLIEEKRLWPHEVKGEGHYAALIEKVDILGNGDEIRANRSEKRFDKINNKILNDYLIFEKETLNHAYTDRLVLVSDQLYQLPLACPNLDGIHVLRGGLCLGTLKKNRFEPAHALALAADNKEVKRRINIDDIDLAVAYLKGEALRIEAEDGWSVICYKDFPLGWVKSVGGQLKNHYPKGLRLL